MAIPKDEPDLIKSLKTLYKITIDKAKDIIDTLLADVMLHVHRNKMTDGKYGIPIELNSATKAAIEITIKGPRVFIDDLVSLKVHKKYALNKPVRIYT
ncbi:MAG: hypothetical protein KAS32_23305 [Candidatus Peribacteraceae bacterium]|nr:hypothetical protein [Candidatus Peribacteraceae bacterium]